MHKTFRIYQRPLDRLRERCGGKRRHYEHHALSDVSFTLGPAEALAILGANGAGKSTLLKLITGVLLPDAGQILTRGRITGLLELGTGFDGHLSGRDNIWLNAGFLGMTQNEIATMLDEIISFAELDKYIDAPVRTYSSGMLMRLGFSIAIHARPNCFVIDEALAVGDARFQQKCLRKIQAFREAGGSLLFVTHDLNAVKVLCERALVLERGKIVFEGPPQQACLVYQKQLMRMGSAPSCQRYGNGAVRIAAVDMTNDQGVAGRFASGEMVNLKVRLESEVDTSELTLGFMIRDRLGQDIFGTNTELRGQTLTLSRGMICDVEFRFALNVGAGQYTVTLGLHDKSDYTANVQDWWNDSLQFEVDTGGRADYVGVCPLPLEGIRIHSLERV